MEFEQSPEKDTSTPTGTNEIESVVQRALRSGILFPKEGEDALGSQYLSEPNNMVRLTTLLVVAASPNEYEWRRGSAC